MKLSAPLVFSWAVMLMCSVTSLQAATIVTIPLESGQFVDPDGLVFDQLLSGSTPNDTFERDVKQNRANAQTFTLGDSTTIDKIAINFQESTLSETAFATFEFFTVAYPSPTTLTPGPIIDSVTFSGSDLTYSSGTLVFDVTDTFAAAETSYGIRFTTESSTPLVFKWTFTAENFEGGMRYEGGSRQIVDDYTIGVIAVPEPTSLTMLGLMGGAIALMRRRRC